MAFTVYYKLKNKTMKIKFLFASLILLIICVSASYSQEEDLKNVDYNIVAQGTDAPLPNLQIVCFNKYFNKDYLPTDFRKKYSLDEKSLYRKKMLVELFYTDTDGKGLDKIELVEIHESDKNLIVSYNLVNSDTTNDDEKLSFFLIAQVPKSKKDIKFVVNGSELEPGTNFYVD